MNAIWGHLGGFGKILLLMGLIFVSLMVFSLLALLAILPFIDGFPLSGESEPLSINTLRYFQIIQSFSVFIIPSLMAGILFWGHPIRGIGFGQPNGKMILISLLAIVAASPLVNYLGIWNSSMELPEILGGLEQWMEQSEKNAADIIYRFLDTDHIGILLLNFLMIAVLPAIGEEMLFRGTLQPIFNEWLRNKHLAVIVTAILFSAIHLQFFTFLPRFFLGMALGYMMLWGKNLWYPIAGHFANNFLSLIVFYYYQHTHPEINPLEPGSEDLSVGWIFPATALMAFLFWKFFVIAANKKKISDVQEI
jgi:membrane protease YdiL (CAAX protease family)